MSSELLAGTPNLSVQLYMYCNCNKCTVTMCAHLIVHRFVFRSLCLYLISIKSITCEHYLRNLTTLYLLSKRFNMRATGLLGMPTSSNRLVLNRYWVFSMASFKAAASQMVSIRPLAMLSHNGKDGTDTYTWGVPTVKL